MSLHDDLQMGKQLLNTRILCPKSIPDVNIGEGLAFVCSICGYVANSEINLKKHLFIHTDGILFSCTICDHVTKSKELLKNHMFKVHLRCKKCDFIGQDRSSLDIHFTVHAKEKRFQCTGCDYACSQNNALIIHKLNKHVINFKCLVCDYDGNNKLELDRHFLTHRIDDHFKCPKCDYKSSKKNHLKIHFFLIHADEHQYKCSKCDFKSSGKLSLKRHMTKIHKDNSRSLGVKFRSNKKHLLKKKTITRRIENTVKCTNCNNEFSNKDELESHMVIHLNEEPFVCYLCGFGTKDRYSLENHFLIHTGEKEF